MKNNKTKNKPVEQELLSPETELELSNGKEEGEE